MCVEREGQHNSKDKVYFSSESNKLKKKERKEKEERKAPSPSSSPAAPGVVL